jgi:hypothetical protein
MFLEKKAVLPVLIDKEELIKRKSGVQKNNKLIFELKRIPG